MATLSDPEPYYRVRVTAGPYTWNLTRDPAAPVAPAYGLADPLVVGWSTPEDGTVLPHPDPMFARFSVLVADVADVAQLALGQPVDLWVWAWPAGVHDPVTGVDYQPIVRFRGRVGAVPSMTPHEVGMLVTVSCVDYTVDWSEVDVGMLAAWPQETFNNRVYRIAGELGISSSAAVGLLCSYGGDLAARNASAIHARDAFVDLYRQGVDLNNTAWDGFTMFLIPDYADEVNDTAPNGPARFKAVSSGLRQKAHYGNPSQNLPLLPGKLAITSPGKYGVAIIEHASDVTRVMHGDDVRFDDVVWAMTKGTRPDTITVTGQFPGGQAGVTVAQPNAVPKRATIRTDLVDAYIAFQLGLFNLLDSDTDNWLLDKVTFLADRDPRVLIYPVPLLYDAWTAPVGQALPSPGLAAPAVLADLVPAQNPAGSNWYAGQIAGCVFTLANGRYSCSVQLRRNLPRPVPLTAAASLFYMAWQHAQTGVAGSGLPYTAIKWSDLDRTFSWFDARLLRSPYA